SRLAVSGASAISSTTADAGKLTISADATYFASHAFGSHQAQAGIYLQPKLTNHLFVEYANNGTALEEAVLSNPQNVSGGVRVFRKQIFDVARQDNTNLTASDYAFYLQDSWSPAARLTLNLGLRVDLITRTDKIFNVTTQDSREIGPRLGANYL